MFLKVIIIGCILGTVLSKIVDSTKTFEEVISETINHKTCEDTEEWSLVDNDNRPVIKPYKSSEAILIVSGSLELYVHVKTAVKTKFLITISNEDNVQVSYVYSGSRLESEICFCKLVFPVEYSGIGYINLLGYSDDNEKVLIDSLYYELKISRINRDNGKQAALLFINEHKISNADGPERYDSKYLENEIIKKLRTEDEEPSDGTEDDIESQEGGNKLLHPWIIALIAVASVTIIGMVAVGAYHLGLNKGLANNPTYIEDVEPTRVVIIPRVRGVTDSPIGEFM